MKPFPDSSAENKQPAWRTDLKSGNHKQLKKPFKGKHYVSLMIGNASYSGHNIFKAFTQRSPLDTEETLPFFDKIPAIRSSLENACIVMTKFSQLQSKCHFSEVRLRFAFQSEGSICHFKAPFFPEHMCHVPGNLKLRSSSPAAVEQLSWLVQLCHLTSAEHPTWSLIRFLLNPFALFFFT